MGPSEPIRPDGTAKPVPPVRSSISPEFFQEASYFVQGASLSQPGERRLEFLGFAIRSPSPAGEFIRDCSVEPVVKFGVRSKSKEKPVSQQVGGGSDAAGGLISFGTRRYVSKGPRRLFQPQECVMLPMIEPTPGRLRSLLRSI